MKKFFTMLTVLVMLATLTSCTGDKLTMKKVVEANKTEILLEKYENVHIIGTANGEKYIEYYLTEDMSYEEGSGRATYLTDDMGYMHNEGVFSRLTYFSRDGLLDNVERREEKYQYVFLSEDSLHEKILSVSEADGKITIITEMNEKTLDKIVGKEGLESFVGEYVIDAETYELISGKGTFVGEDGTTVILAGEFTYDSDEAPEKLATILEYANQKDDLRTATLVFNPGTRKEKTEYIKVPRGIGISLANAVDTVNSYGLYADADCTKPYSNNGDFDSDTTVYIKWKK